MIFGRAHKYDSLYPYYEASAGLPGGNHTKWKRHFIGEIDGLRGQHNNTDLMVSLQQYGTRSSIEGEKSWAHLCFDFDDSNGNIDTCLKDAIAVKDHFTALGLGPEFLRLFFSGSKGFHLVVFGPAIGAFPTENLHLIYKQYASFLKHFLGLTTIDLAIYTKRRLLRLYDSIHPKTGLYKIELDWSLVSGGVDAIRAKAQSPQGLLYDDSEYSEVFPEGSAQAFFDRFRQEQARIDEHVKSKPTKPIAVVSGSIPSCVQDLLTNHIRRSGDRNMGTMSLAAFYKDQGVPIADAEATIVEWALRTPKTLTSTTDDKTLTANTKSVVKSVYENNDFHFVCNVLRSAGMQCNQPCPFTTEADQEPETPPELHLAEASKAVYLDRKLRSHVFVSGKDEHPYIIPTRFKFSCGGGALNKDGEPSSKCLSCGMFRNWDGSDPRIVQEFEVNPRSRLLLELFQCKRSEQMPAVCGYMGIDHKCTKVKKEVLSYGNIEEVELCPNVGPQDLDNPMVTRRAFYFGHGLMDNTAYDIHLFTHPHPQSQHVVHIFGDAKPEIDDINEFTMTPEIYERLKIFQVKPGQDIAKQLDNIYEDLETNVCRIWNRREIMLVMDLSIHSVLFFTFQQNRVKKGWVEVTVVGDSGQGKTAVADAFIEHYRVGERYGAESANRTGMLWTWRQTAQGSWLLSWGFIPRNDRRVVVLDEMKDANQEDLKKMSEMRSSGQLHAAGPRSGTTNARTRLIFLTNTASGRQLATYDYGIESLTEIFRANEDIRRIDLALAVRSGDVASDIMNRQTADIPVVPHVYESDLCHQLVMWAWTRRVHQVEIEPDAESAIIRESMVISQKYTSAIPLVEPSDQRNKLARLSVALAARLFSTPDGHRLVVKQEHVEFVSHFIQRIYDHPSMDYQGYSIKNPIDVGSNMDYGALELEWEKLPGNRILATVLLRYKTFTKSCIQDGGGFSKDSIRWIMKYLISEGLVRSHGRGYSKTEKLISFLKRYTQDHPMTSHDRDTIEETGGWDERAQPDHDDSFLGSIDPPDSNEPPPF